MNIILIPSHFFKTWNVNKLFILKGSLSNIFRWDYIFLIYFTVLADWWALDFEWHIFHILSQNYQYTSLMGGVIYSHYFSHNIWDDIKKILFYELKLEYYIYINSGWGSWFKVFLIKKRKRLLKHGVLKFLFIKVKVTPTFRRRVEDGYLTL